MSVKAVGFVVAASMAVAACGSPTQRPPSGCESIESGCGSTPNLPGVQGSMTPGATPGSDAGVTSVDVAGRVFVVTALPRPLAATGLREAPAWLVGPRGATGLDTTTDANGRFVIPGVPAVGGRYVLRTLPPVGGGTLGAVADFGTELATSSTIVAVTENVLATSLSATAVTASPRLAHVIVEVLEGGARVSGVRGAVDGASASITYDDAAGVLSSSVDRTGPLGTIALFNVDAPADGRWITLRLSRLPTGPGTGIEVAYRVYVVQGYVSFVSAPAPP